MALVDRLTNVYNRQAFEIMIKEAIKENKRNKIEISLMILDIDEFKNINDTYGHIVGDKVIKKIAEILMNSIREIDNVFRWGGDEFVIVLKNCNLENAYKIGEKIKTTIFEMELKEKSEKIKISISAGVVQYKENETEDEVLKRADELLYKSKEKGKNRIEK